MLLVGNVSTLTERERCGGVYLIRLIVCSVFHLTHVFVRYVCNLKFHVI